MTVEREVAVDRARAELRALLDGLAAVGVPCSATLVIGESQRGALRVVESSPAHAVYEAA